MVEIPCCPNGHICPNCGKRYQTKKHHTKPCPLPDPAPWCPECGVSNQKNKR